MLIGIPYPVVYEAPKTYALPPASSEYYSDALNDCLMNEICSQKLEKIAQAHKNGNTIEDYYEDDN